MSDNTATKNEPTLAETVAAIHRGSIQVGAALAKMAETIRASATEIGRAVLNARLARFDARTVHGAWNFTGDGLWQSDLCAAWVHDACGLPGSCDCTCHGGFLR